MRCNPANSSRGRLGVDGNDRIAEVGVPAGMPHASVRYSGEMPVT